MRLRAEHEFENSRIAALKKKRDRAYKRYKKTGLIAFFKKSKSLTKTLKKVIRKERKRVFRAKMESHGSKGFWLQHWYTCWRCCSADCFSLPHASHPSQKR
jgi:hypothetical protein